MFCNIILTILDQYDPRKAKYARGNQMLFMTKNLSKNIVKRSRLRNKYLKIMMRKIENCVPNKEISASLC